MEAEKPGLLTTNNTPNEIGSGSPQGIYSCSTCNKLYHRQDHLKRHERTHTAIRPYSCPECRSNFTRSLLARKRDVLNQHLEQHQGQRGCRGRAGHACDRCFARKTKCDGDFPCKPCLASNIDCTRQRSKSMRQRKTRGGTAPHLDDSNCRLQSTGPSEPLVSTSSRAESSSGLLSGIPRSGTLDLSYPVNETPPDAVLDSNDYTLPSPHLGFDPTDGAMPDISDSYFQALDIQSIWGYDWSTFDEFLPEPPWSTLVDQDPQHPESNTASAHLHMYNTTPSLQAVQASSSHVVSPSSSIAQSYQHRNSEILATPPKNPWPTTLDRLPQQQSRNSSTRIGCTPVNIVWEIKLGKLENIPVMLDEPTWRKIEIGIFTPCCQELGLTQDEQKCPGAVLNHLMDSYFAKFHSAWPILHRATFHLTRQPSILALSVLMIGAFMSGCKDLISVSYKLYTPLKDFLYNRLTDLVQLKTWSLCIYQALLINIVFGFLTVQRADAVMADIAHGVLITLVRRLGFFSDEWIQTECCGETAEIWFTRESKKRLAIALVKIDSCISVAFNRPACVSFEELDMTVPSIQTSWDMTTEIGWRDSKNADWQHRYGLQLSEVIHEIIHGKGNAIPLAEEDYQVCLCSIQGLVWQYKKRMILVSRHAAKNRFTTPSLHREENPMLPYGTPILEILQQWRDHFALASREEPAIPRPLKRSARVCACLIMWHLDIIHLEADIDLIQTLAGSMELAPSRSKDKFLKLQAWAITKSARSSIWHATEIWRLWVEKTEDSHCDSTLLSEPVIPMGLFQSAVLLWAFASTAGSGDNYTGAPENRRGADVIDLTQSVFPNTKLDEWIRIGGPVAFEKIRLCPSQRPVLMQHFEELFRTSLPPDTVGTRLAALLSHLGNSKSLDELYNNDTTSERPPSAE